MPDRVRPVYEEVLLTWVGNLEITAVITAYICRICGYQNSVERERCWMCEQPK
jgi:rubrerythrin